MKDILKVVFVIIGTMIGAGFASGQEIWIFFNRYGNLGILGLILSISLSGFLIYKVFNKLQKENLYTYSQLLEKISECLTAEEAVKIINENNYTEFYDNVSNKCKYKVKQYLCDDDIEVEIMMFSMDKTLLGKSNNTDSLVEVFRW